MKIKRNKISWGFVATCALVPVSQASAKPNVVVFYADDFGWGDMSLHNTNSAHYRYTPNLDRMFTEGIELENYITHSVCSPSRAGLLTGKHYAAVSSGPETGGTLPNNIRNIAKDFQSAGYKTGAFGKWHNGVPNFPAGGNGAVVDFDTERRWSALHGEDTVNLTNNIFENSKGWTWGEGVNAYGFDRWVGYYNGGGDLFDRYSSHKDVDWWHDQNYRGDETGYTTDLITQYASEFIQSNQTSQFFCYVPQEAVHTPLQLKRSDLQEFCGKLETELGITGQWDYVKNIQGLYKVNPATGERDDVNGVYRTIENTAEIRAEEDEEFDTRSIDAAYSHFGPLLYGAYCYSLDKSVGAIIQKVTDIGQLTNTVFMFSSDNGATPNGVNLPFRDGKHSLYEGGVHVPSAIWWPGRFDKNTAPYTPENNKYPGMMTYLDWYPTLMAMTGNPLLGTDLDGMNCWIHLQNQTECRPDLTDAVYGIWRDHGSVRTKRWKLIYSQSRSTVVALYDLSVDIAEATNVASANPLVNEQLIGMYNQWVTTNSYAMSYLSIAQRDIDFPSPAPSGDVLEIKATQTGSISSPDSNGLFVKFSSITGWDEAIQYIESGDRVEFDMYVCLDSTITNGLFLTPAEDGNAFFKSNNGMHQTGVLLANLQSSKGVWTRQVIGIGNQCPDEFSLNFIALRSATAGYYHYYVDNMVIRKSNGDVRLVLWAAAADTAPLTYRYKKVNYSSVSAATAAGAPFSDIQLSTLTYVAPPATSNLVQNASFEDGTNFWSLGGTALIANGAAQNGNSALGMVNYTAGSTWQTIPLQVGTEYDLSVWVHASDLASGSVVFDTSDAYDEPGQGQFTISGSEGWTNYTGRFTATNPSVTFRMVADSAFTGTVYFDNVSLQEAAAPVTNYAPVWNNNPITKPAGYVGVAYSNSLSGDVTDHDGDSLSYAKVSGPAWLTVSANGTLLGTAGSGDIGTNTFTVQIDDGNGGSAETSVQIVVGTLQPGVQVVFQKASGVTNYQSTLTLAFSVDGSGVVMMDASSSGDATAQAAVNVWDGAVGVVQDTNCFNTRFSMTLTANATNGNGTVTVTPTSGGGLAVQGQSSSRIDRPGSEWINLKATINRAVIKFETIQWVNRSGKTALGMLLTGPAGSFSNQMTATSGTWDVSAAGLQVGRAETLRFGNASSTNKANGYALSGFSFNLESVIVSNLFDGWTGDYELNGTNANHAADPDGDGANNLYEYALGGNPTNGSDSAAIEPVARMSGGSGTNWMEYVYNRRNDAEDRGLTYSLELRSDLISGSWSNIGTSAEIGFGPKDTEFDSVTNRIPTVGKTKDFIRLKITEE